jgi:hypothetical protein
MYLIVVTDFSDASAHCFETQRTRPLGTISSCHSENTNKSNGYFPWAMPIFKKLKYCLYDKIVMLQYLFHLMIYVTPPLWSCCQRSWIQTQRPHFGFPVLPHFVRNNSSGKGSTQPPEDKWVNKLKEKYWFRSRKPRLFFPWGLVEPTTRHYCTNKSWY